MAAMARTRHGQRGHGHPRGGPARSAPGDSADTFLTLADTIKGDRARTVSAARRQRLNAKDNKKDKKISCGKGKASKESAKVDKGTKAQVAEIRFRAAAIAPAAAVICSSLAVPAPGPCRRGAEAGGKLQIDSYPGSSPTRSGSAGG
jgi:hypothetical protein